MKLEVEIKELKKEIEEISDPQLIKLIRNLLRYGKSKPEERITAEEYNREIDEAVKRYKKGDYLTHASAKKIIGNW